MQKMEGRSQHATSATHSSRVSDMCHKSEQFRRKHLQCGTEAEGVVPPTATTHNLDVTALPFTSINDYSNQEYAEVKVKEEVLIKEEPTEIEESTRVEDDTVDDNTICSGLSVKVEGVVPTAAIIHNLDVTALPFTSIIDYSNQGYTEVKHKEELLNKEQIEAKEEPIDIEESTLAEDVMIDDNIISSEPPPVKVNTEKDNVFALSFCCDVCNKTFTMRIKLAQHMLIHFNKKQHACNMCDKTFTTGSNLIEHKRVHTGEKPYACNICNKSFSHGGNFNKHKRIHTGEKSYACNICNKSFTRSDNLLKHKRNHTGEKPYACNICNKSFSHGGNFNKHKIIHTGEKPYACNICNKSYTESSNLIRHKKTHTGEKP